MKGGDVSMQRGRLCMEDRGRETAQGRRDYGDEQTPASNGSLPAGANLLWHCEWSLK
jgi:hypothetical protein